MYMYKRRPFASRATELNDWKQQTSRNDLNVRPWREKNRKIIIAIAPTNCAVELLQVRFGTIEILYCVWFTWKRKLEFITNNVYFNPMVWFRPNFYQRGSGFKTKENYLMLRICLLQKMLRLIRNYLQVQTTERAFVSNLIHANER